MKRRTFKVLLAPGLWAGTASAQFGFGGIIDDPTNYAKAVHRYNQRVQQLAQLQRTYTQTLNQYNLALRMA